LAGESAELDQKFTSEWFKAKRERLEGTSVVYKVPTRMFNAKYKLTVVGNPTIVKSCRH
jgi:hypothetical protein